jgi:tetratricopeptide (TPR) repeat protein
MKKNSFYVAIVAVMSGLMLAACGGLGKMEKHIADLGATASPEPLEVHGDSIQLSINGKFPEKYFHKKVVVESTPVLMYDGGEAKFEMKGFQGEQAAGNYEKIPYKTGKSFSYTDKIAYAPGMDTSSLYLKIHGSKGSKTADFDPYKIGTGVITTPYLLKGDDKVVSNKEDKYVRVTSWSKKAEVNFDYNSSVIKPAEGKQDDINALVTFLQAEVAANPKIVIKSIELVAYASPEGEIFLNDELTTERSENTKKMFQSMLKKANLDTLYNPMFTLTAKGEDWDGFRDAMSASAIADKDIIIRILQKTTDLQAREQEIKNISKTYTEIQKDIFPSLRRCTIVINYDLNGYTDAELTTIAKSNPSSLKYEEAMTAALLVEDVNTKASIYSAAESMSGADYRASNNLGVILYGQNKVSEAETKFKKAYDMSKNNETSCNMGAVTRLKGDRKAAMTYLNASSTNEAKYNKGLINIQDGDYASAVSNMSNYKTFNSALAKLLSKDNGGAQSDMDASNDTSAMADYLRAVIAARSNDASAVASNLKTAVQKDASLVNKAKKDLEFRNFKSALIF